MVKNRFSISISFKVIYNNLLKVRSFNQYFYYIILCFSWLISFLRSYYQMNSLHALDGDRRKIKKTKVKVFSMHMINTFPFFAQNLMKQRKSYFLTLFCNFYYFTSMKLVLVNYCNIY